jgi:DNA-binding MarR family transcriptional regulator
MTKEMEQLYAELFDTAGLGRRVGEQIAAREGQTQARWQTMWTIDAAEALTVPQIARRLGVSRQNEQRVVNDLVAAKLAAFHDNPDHKSSPLVQLTPKGSTVLDSINVAADQSHSQILASFAVPQIRQLRKLLRAFAEATRTAHPDLS